MKKAIFPLFFCLFIPAFVFAQAEDKKRTNDIWLCPGGETAFYSVSGMAYGGGFSFGYGSGTSIGLKAAYFYSPEGTGTFELNFLFRVYLLGASAYSGPFIQLGGGPVFFFTNDSGGNLPLEKGAISAGLSAGWRFLFGDRWVIEPAVRGGYPYLFGAGVSAGVRF